MAKTNHITFCPRFYIQVDSDASAGGAAGQGETQARAVEEVDVHESVVLDPGATVTSTQEKKTEL